MAVNVLKHLGANPGSPITNSTPDASIYHVLSANFLEHIRKRKWSLSTDVARLNSQTLSCSQNCKFETDLPSSEERCPRQKTYKEQPSSAAALLWSMSY